jgi:hypothetical protein
VWILGGPEVLLSKGSTSVTTTEDGAVFWEKKEYKPPTFEELEPRTPSGTSEL